MKRAVIVARSLDPEAGSEAGKAHLWVKTIARYYDVDVFVRRESQESIVRSLSDYPRARFHFVVVTETAKRILGKWEFTTPILNAIFVSGVKRKLLGMDLSEYALIHVLTPSGVHSFNNLYELGIPVLAGPLGGALPTHPGFREVFADERLTNLLRTMFYRFVIYLPSWREYFLNADAILAGTDAVVDFLPAECRSRSRIIFDTCVDTDFFKPASVRRPVRPRLKIIFAGKLSAMKGAVLLIEAVQLCRARGVQSIEAVLFGDGPLRERLQRQISDYGLEGCVTLGGHVPRRELVKEYQESDVFCLPTLREPGGGSILEAMACGLPVITSDYGGPGYSVTDDCGIKIDMVDPRQYAADLSFAIERLVRDEGLRRSMGHDARRRAVEEFSLQALDGKIQDIYREYMAESAV